jgi:hypothetical protein
MVDIGIQNLHTRDFKLQNKMAGQSQKVWILKDFALNQSICGTVRYMIKLNYYNLIYANVHVDI